jgi:hypothetical protein
VPVRTFLEHDHAFGPEDIASLSAAFEAALSKLELVDRTDPATMAVAKLIIEFAKQGERRPERLCALAVQQLSKSARNSAATGHVFPSGHKNTSRGIRPRVPKTPPSRIWGRGSRMRQ